MDTLSAYLGIDPGKKGGAALLDAAGGFLDAWRWKEGGADPRHSGADPRHSYDLLLRYGVRVVFTYIEKIELFRHLPINILLNTQALLVNVGQWLAVLDLLSLNYGQITPEAWQARYGLRHWRKRQAKLQALTKAAQVPALTSPLALARHLWPQAPLRTQADDGMAVALLLADLARRDHQLARRNPPLAQRRIG